MPAAPHSGSAGSCARSSAQSLRSLRGRGTQRYRCPTAPDLRPSDTARTATANARCAVPTTRSEIVVKTHQPIEVDSALINPHDLHDFFLAAARCPAKKPWSSNASRLSGRASPLDARPSEIARAARIRTGTDQPPRSQDLPVTPVGAVTGDDAARDGVSLGGVEPIHRITLTALYPSRSPLSVKSH